MISAVDQLDARAVLFAVEAARRDEMRAQAETLELAAHWCDLHGEMEYDAEARVANLGDERLIGIGGDGTPVVEEFAAAEFGAMRHQHPIAARNLMADALDLRHRLPRLWSAVRELRIEAWAARKVALLSRKLDRHQAALLDVAITAHVETLPPGRLLALVEATIIELDPERAESERQAREETRFVSTRKDAGGMMTLVARAGAGDLVVFMAMVSRIAEILGEQGDTEDLSIRKAKAIGLLARPAEALRLLLEGAAAAGVPDAEAEEELGATPLRRLLAEVGPALLPRFQLFAHIADSAVARIEGIGPVTVDQLRSWLGHTHVTVTPVLDLADQRPVDGYEFPSRLREAAHQLSPVEPFPWSVNRGRRRDADHCEPYVQPDRGGPPGQTALENLALLTRHHHRLKTFGGWQLYCDSPGRYLWRSPHGFLFAVDENGTRRIGEMYRADLTLVA